MAGRFVAYYRVSTAAQGASGLGLEAQQAAVRLYLHGQQGEPFREFVEIESGKHNDRPQLRAALELCRLTGATLLIAKLDRLSRNAAFLLSLRDAGVDFIAVDNPNATRLTVGILAVVAEDERERISQRTKAALAAAKARGTKLGNPVGFGGAVYRQGGEAAQRGADQFASKLLPTIQGLKADGLSLNAIAKRLTEGHYRTARGGAWTPTAVKNILKRA
jgi:DNA invertase Pin-like site-specific DNA recombinase